MDDSEAKRDRVLREALGCRVELVAYARAMLGNYTGADVNSEDDSGFTPLDATNYDRESERKAKLEIAELLREKGGKSAPEHPQERVHH